MRYVMLFGLGLIFMMVTGCSKVASTGIEIARGVQADVLPIRDISPGTIARYNSVKVGDVTTDVGRICPPRVQTQVRAQMQIVFAEKLKEQFTGGGSTLMVNAVCRFFKKKGRIGGEGRLDLLVTLVDSESNEPQGTFYVEGITGSPLHTDIEDMAKGVAKEVAKYLAEKKGDR